MNCKRYCLLAFAICTLVPLLVFGQELRLAPYSGPGTFLNQQIAADTVANGKLATRVYVLQRGALYLANAVFTNAGGWKLSIKANDSATTKKPVIMLYPTGAGNTPWNPPGNFVQMGGDLVLKNLEISGYYELVDTNRFNMQGALINIPSTASGLNITIDSCILSNTNGNHVRTDGVPSTIKITNSLFANLGYLGRSNLGAGKALDLRASACDSLIMVNNTFVNWLDRIVRHYPNSGSGTGLLNYFRFEHNTLVNGTSYHGLLSLGTMGAKAIIANNLFIDPFVLGNDTDATRQVEFLPSGEVDPYGNPKMAWIFSYPNNTTQWIVSNNYYSISDSGQAFYTTYASAGVTGEGSPITLHIGSKLGSGASSAFTKLSVALTKIPMVMTNLARWYRSPTGGKKLKNTPGAWTYGTLGNPDPYDYDRKSYSWLRDSLKCDYSTSSAAYSGATGGFPVGDLNWFPAIKASWLASPVSGVENKTQLPEAFSLDQNYPNPFNPATQIAYSVPSKTRVSLEVFDVLGRRIATLVDGIVQPGRYSVEFDASKLASGVYFYRLSTSQQILSRKMVLLK